MHSDFRGGAMALCPDPARAFWFLAPQSQRGRSGRRANWRPRELQGVPIAFLHFEWSMLVFGVFGED